MNARATIRFEQRFAVRAIGLVATSVGPHESGWQQDDVKAARDQEAGPEVRARTGLHDDATRRLVDPEPLELGTRKTLSLVNRSCATRDGELENILGQVDCNCYRRHGMGS